MPPFRHYFILHVKRKGKNNISLQTLSIMYLYKANVRIVYDIFPYAHFPQQPVVLLTVWFGCLCFWTTNLRRFFYWTLSFFMQNARLFIFHTTHRAQVPCIFIHFVNRLDYERDAVSLSVNIMIENIIWNYDGTTKKRNLYMTENALFIFSFL